MPMNPRKLRHRPSDELIDIRERGLPWLLSVFILLFFLLTLLLIYFLFTTRQVYLSQRNLVGHVVIGHGDDTGEKYSQESEESLEDVHVDIVPIMNRITGSPDNPVTSTETPPTTTPAPIDFQPFQTPLPTRLIPTTTAEPATTTTTPIATVTPQEIFETTTTTQAAPTTTPPSTTTTTPTVTQDFSENLDFETTTPTATVTPQTTTTTVTQDYSESESEETAEEAEEAAVDPAIRVTLTNVLEAEVTSTSTSAPSHPDIKWDRQIRSQSTDFQQFAINTQHIECSKIGRLIYEAGGNAIDSTIASEFCISFVHPHSSGPGFGAILIVHSSKRNGTYVIDGRERAPKTANQNTFVINPTIAHIGYSSMGVPGWVSTLWSAYKQFGSGKISWNELINPTIQLAQRGIFIDRILKSAFDSRKNHILHEKSFESILNKTTEQNTLFFNPEYLKFLETLAESSHAEHDFYSGPIAKMILEEIKKRGGLITRHDFETYSSIVTRAELLPIFDSFVAGPHLPYSFPILSKLFAELSSKYEPTQENEKSIEFFEDFARILQNASRMKMFAGDDLFEPEVKLKVEQWQIPKDFKPEEHVDQNPHNKKFSQPFSRILAIDNAGNTVNFMSTSTVAFGSVRRSPTYGFVWNNAMSSFDVFCRYDINCVRGGSRPAVTKQLPSIVLDREKRPIMAISPTTLPLETTAQLIMNTIVLKLPISSVIDSARLYPQSIDKLIVETGIPDVLYGHLWKSFRAQYSHPSHPVTVLTNSSIFCDFRYSSPCFSNVI